MNIPEARRVLQMISAVDRRQVDEDVVAAWADLLDEVEVEEALAAVKAFFRSEPDKIITPGHIVRLAREAGAARYAAWRARQPLRTPLGFPEDSIEGREAQRRFEEALAERFSAPLLPPPFQVVESPALEWERQRRIGEALARAQHPTITDLDRIEEIERARTRYLDVLKQMGDADAGRAEAPDPGTDPYRSAEPGGFAEGPVR